MDTVLVATQETDLVRLRYPLPLPPPNPYLSCVRLVVCGVWCVGAAARKPSIQVCKGSRESPIPCVGGLTVGQERSRLSTMGETTTRLASAAWAAQLRTQRRLDFR